MSTKQLSLHCSPPFRAEHLGSLLRPEKLLQTREANEKGNVTDADLAKAEDEAVTEIVDMQQKLGFRAMTDGEYRRHSKAPRLFWHALLQSMLLHNCLPQLPFPQADFMQCSGEPSIPDSMASKK